MDEDVKAQVDNVVASFRSKGTKINSNLGKAITTACLMVEREAKLGMTPNGPSAPGQPPAVDTGRLRASITHRIEGGGYEERTIGYVGTNVEYAPYLEFGTSKMAARPWLTPALEKHREDIKRLIKDATIKGAKNQDGGEENA